MLGDPTRTTRYREYAAGESACTIGTAIIHK
jgi:hypothetical protein